MEADVNHTPNRIGWLLLGLLAGFALGSGMFRWWPAPIGMPVGAPDMSIVLVAGIFITMWIVLVAGAIRWLFVGRDPQRLADLPADFDDWHRRAHAQMAREAASAADPGRRG